MHDLVVIHQHVRSQSLRARFIITFVMLERILSANKNMLSDIAAIFASSPALGVAYPQAWHVHLAQVPGAWHMTGLPWITLDKLVRYTKKQETQRTP